MKVALLIQGMYRTFGRCWPKMYAAFEKYAPDIYIYSHEPRDLESIRLVTPSSLKVRTTVFEEPDDPQPEHDYASHLGTGVKSLQVDLRQLNDLQSLSRRVRGTGIVYDWVIRLRTDLDMITLPEPLECLDPRFAYVPTHDNWFGLCDRFMMGPPALVHKAMERYDHLPEFWEAHHVFHMESFLAWAMRDEIQAGLIARTRTTFGIARTSGEIVPPFRNSKWMDSPAVEVCQTGFRDENNNPSLAVNECSYSQNGEDAFIWENRKAMGLPEIGTFCEVGAADGVKFSNTLMFSERGWTGVLVEPDPRQIPSLINNRLDPIVPCAIGDHDRPFVLCNNDLQWSGFDRNDGDRISISVRRLDDVLRDQGIKNLDFLSIDTEGTELEVWKTRGTYNPRVVMMEHCTWDLPGNDQRNAEQHRQMQADGYELFHSNSLNNIWVRTDRHVKTIQVVSHSGDYGDLIYGLCILSKLKRADIQLVLYPAECGPRERMTVARAEGVERLLLTQDYIHGVTWCPVPKGKDLEPFRRCWDKNHTIVQAYCRFFGITYKPELISEPWLKVKPRTGTGKTVISRTARYHGRNFPWLKILDRFPMPQFVGTEAEYTQFIREFGGLRLAYEPTKDLLEAAQIIAGADVFIGNQSAALAMAIGLGVPHIVECCPEQNDCNYGKLDSQYVLDGNVRGL